MCNSPENDPLLDENSKPHLPNHESVYKGTFIASISTAIWIQGIRHHGILLLPKHGFVPFMDLVNPTSIPGSLRMQDRLRLRVASRKQKCPSHMLLCKPGLNENDDPLEGSEDDFSPIGSICGLQLIHPHRSMTCFIYATEPPNDITGISRANRAIVMISFDHHGISRDCLHHHH